VAYISDVMVLIEDLLAAQRNRDVDILQKAIEYGDENGYPMGGSQGIAREYLKLIIEDILNQNNHD